MTTSHAVTAHASSKRTGATLREYAAFVEAAMAAGATGDEKVDVLVNLRRGAKTLTVAVAGRGTSTQVGLA